MKTKLKKLLAGTLSAVMLTSSFSAIPAFAETPTAELFAVQNDDIRSYGSHLKAGEWDIYTDNIHCYSVDNGTGIVFELTSNAQTTDMKPYNGGSSSLGSKNQWDYILGVRQNSGAAAKNITKAYFKDGITSIGYSALCNFTALQYVEMPDSVTEITDYAFSRSTFDGMKFSPNLEKIGYGAFSGAYTLDFSQTKLREIGYGALRDCYCMVKLPATLKTVDKYALGCTYTSKSDSVCEFKFPEGVEQIGSQVFTAGMTPVNKIYVPSTVTSIASDAFFITTCDADIYVNNYENAIAGAPWCKYGVAVHSTHWLGDIEISPIDDQYSFGGAATPKVNVKFISQSSANSTNAKTLIEGTDYYVTYANNSNAGTATATVHFMGEYSNYNGGNKSINFNIVRYDPISIEAVPTQYYNGGLVTPKLTVNYNDSYKGINKVLSEGLDYTVEYLSNNDVDTGTATITYLGEYAGYDGAAKSVQFEILPFDPSMTPKGPINMSNVDIEIENTVFQWTYPMWGGDNNTTNIHASYTYNLSDGTTYTYQLTNGTDYQTTYSNNTGEGTAIVEITGIGEFTGTYNGTFTIYSAFLPSTANDMFTFPEVNIEFERGNTYTGEDLSEGILIDTITLHGLDDCPRTLYNYFSGGWDSPDNFDVVLPTPIINAGEYTYKLYGGGNFTGTMTGTFTINPCNLDDVSIECETDMTYYGEEVMPKITAAYNGMTLKEGKDYTVAYFNNNGEGTGTAEITGIGNFTGTKTVDFEIKGFDPKNGVDSVFIDESDIVSATIDGTFVYNGKEHTPTPRLVYHFVNPTTNVAIDYDMVEGEDFEIVSYEDNINAGEATVIVQGIGAFENTKPIFFDISPCELSTTTIADIPSAEYCKKDICPDVEIKVGDTVMTNVVDYDLSYENNRNRGTATVTITGKGNLTGVMTKTFEITPRDGSRFTYYIILP